MNESHTLNDAEFGDKPLLSPPERQRQRNLSVAIDVDVAGGRDPN